MKVCIGNYTGTPDQTAEISVFDFCESSGQLAFYQAIQSADRPSFLAWDATAKTLWAVSEAEAGAVTPIPINNNRPARAAVPTRGASPCHVATDPLGEFVFATNYNGASVTMIAVASDSPRVVYQQFHTGSSVHPTRQTRPHPHSSWVDPSGKLLFVADLGIDEIRIFRIKRAKQKLIPHKPASIALPPGSGPRHLAFHAASATLYVLNELTATVTAMRCAEPFTEFPMLEQVSIAPPDYLGTYSGAEVAVHPNGKFLITSERASQTLGVFSIDPATGSLRPLSWHPAGRTPRHFAIHPAGRWLICAHQDDDTLQVWSIDPTTGRMHAQGSSVVTSSPSCVCFLHDKP